MELSERLRRLLEEGPQTLDAIPWLLPRMVFWYKRVNWGIFPEHGANKLVTE